MRHEVLKRYSAMYLASAPLVRGTQDLRDYIFGSTAADNRSTDFKWDLSKLPSRVDLLPFTETVEDQEQYGSCVGHGIITAVETMLKCRNTAQNLSPMFAYYNARRKMQLQSGGAISDSGASIRSGCAAAGTWGLCREELWPYRTVGVNQQPIASAYTDGLSRLVTRYETCGGANLQGKRDLIADIKVAIACGYPVVFGTALLEKFYYIQGPLSTHVQQYTSNEILYTDPANIGNHCMCVIGYDDALQAVIVENSWGPLWGDGGFVALSYDHMRNNAFDCFVLREVAGMRLEIPETYYGRAPIPQPTPTPTPTPTPVPPTPQPEPAPLDWSKMSLKEIVKAIIAALTAMLGKL